MEECSEGSCFSNDEDIRCPGPLFRTKLFVLGSRDEDKLKLIRCLIGHQITSNIHIMDDDFGVNVQLWYPFKTSDAASLLDRPVTGVERHLTLECWILTGRKKCETAHGNYLTSEAMYIITINPSSPNYIDELILYYQQIILKVPQCPVFLVIMDSIDQHLDERTILDKLLTTVKDHAQTLHSKISDLSNHISKFDTNRRQHSPQNYATDSLHYIPHASLLEEKLCYENILNHLPLCPDRIFNVNSVNHLGIREIKTRILSDALDRHLFPHLDLIIKPYIITLYDEILKLRERDVIILPWNTFREFGSSFPDFNIEQYTNFLETVGGVLNFQKLLKRKPENEKFICVNPSAFVNLICTLLMDANQRDIKFQSSQFWPPDSGFKCPDRKTLGIVFDSIPRHGVVRESIIPLLWQKYDLSEEQIQHIISLLTIIGILIPYKLYKTNCEGLAMPEYTSLSVQKSYAISLLQKLPDVRPQLNWTSRPFKGDIQITWRFEFNSDFIPGWKQQILGICLSAKPYSTTYHYIWKHGLLLKVGEVTLCIDAIDGGMDFSCRCNGDIKEEINTSIKQSWFTLIWYISLITELLSLWPVLIVQNKLRVSGDPFYTDCGYIADNEPILDVSYCLSCWKLEQSYQINNDIQWNVLFPVSANTGEVHNMTSWIRYIEDQPEYYKLLSSKPALPSKQHKAQLSSGNRRSRKLLTKTNPEIKWNLAETKQLSKTATMNNNNEESEKIVDDSGCNSCKTEESSPELSLLTTSEYEECKIEIYKITSCFVATVLAGAVAQIIEEDYKDGNLHSLSSSQVKAAKLTAEATRATQKGDMEGAVKAVLLAVELNKPAADELILSKKNFKKGAKSKTCCLF